MTVAWVFPGQGSQKKGMSDVVIDFPGARERFEFASELLGRDLLKICEAKDLNELQPSDINDTRNTQPALFVVESLIVDELRKKGQSPSFVAGHSLGEIVALYAADVFDIKTGLRLLKRRSELMASAGGGAMTAVLGFDRAELEGLVNSQKGIVIANDNSSSQVVLSGTPEAVKKVTTQLNCKKAIPLQVSGAFHSPFMEEASKSFALELDQVSFNNASFPVLSNSEPSPITDGMILKERLKNQMSSGVRWRETMNVMVHNKINTIFEIGPGNVLSGLIKRSMKDVVVKQIFSESDVGN
tara:strand:- start:3446 stop:4342 length:897 start_codon:yes stop_codon:yes gene_type:complete